MRALGDDDGCPPLGLPALGSFLWSEQALPHLDAAQLPNRALLEAVRALATVRDGEVLRARRLQEPRRRGARLGLRVAARAAPASSTSTPARSRSTTAAGNERKTTG